MSISYEDALQVLLSELAPRWVHGTFYLDDKEIVETDDAYIFKVGAREYLVDGDVSFAIAGGLPVVWKNSGELGSLSSRDVALDPAVRVTANPNAIFGS
jgi:hypothetical protein